MPREKLKIEAPDRGVPAATDCAWRAELGLSVEAWRLHGWAAVRPGKSLEFLRQLKPLLLEAKVKRAVPRARACSALRAFRCLDQAVFDFRMLGPAVRIDEQRLPFGKVMHGAAMRATYRCGQIGQCPEGLGLGFDSGRQVLSGRRASKQDGCHGALPRQSHGTSATKYLWHKLRSPYSILGEVGKHSTFYVKLFDHDAGPSGWAQRRRRFCRLASGREAGYIRPPETTFHRHELRRLFPAAGRVRPRP